MRSAGCEALSCRTSGPRLSVPGLIIGDVRGRRFDEVVSLPLDTDRPRRTAGEGVGDGLDRGEGIPLAGGSVS